MILGTAPRDFGFNPFSTVARAVVKSHVVGTRAIAKAIRDPRVQQAAIAAGSAYGGRAGQAAQYAQMLRPPPGAVLAPPPGPPPDGSDNADEVPAGPAAPIHKTNILLYAGLAGVGLLAFLLLKK